MSEESSPHRPSPVLVVVPLLVVAGALALMVRRFAAPVTNPDTFFHLRLGQEFLSGWAPWDPGAITEHASADWAPTQWLSQVAYAAVEQWWGLPGLAWLTGTVAVALVVTTAVTARAWGGLVSAAPVTVLAVSALAPFLSSRPQVASYLLVVLFTSGWLRSAVHGTTPWWMVPATWLWAMLHGMWLSGVVLGLVAALGLTLDRRPGSDSGTTRPRSPWWHPWAVPLLSLGAAGLTPVGPSLYGAATRVGGISHYFAEWGAPEVTDPTTAIAGLMLVWVLLIHLRRPTRSWLELLLLLLAAAWLAYAQRSVPVAVAMLVPLLALSLGRMLPRREGRRWELGALVGLGVATSAVLALLVPVTADEVPRAGSAPSAAAAALPPGTGLLNDWGLGGTDIWLYPELQVVMHGYGDMFTDDELERNAELVDLDPGWDRTLAELGLTHALLPAEARLAYALEELEGWTVAAEDEDLVFLVAPAGWPVDE